MNLSPDVELYKDMRYKIGKSHLDFNARWIHDFDVRNAVEDDGFNFTASLKF